jgi:gliding motility-associated-like protein/uncharacterized repeat protein (TIGR01451 family)
MDIEVTTEITPTFTQIGPLCQNSTAPALPGNSTNGITGTWSPAVISTTTVGTTTYTFTPTAGQCAAEVKMEVEVTTEITPIFTQIGPLCQNSTDPALPATSNNGITGTWSPATINTSSTGTTTYTFTPAAGQCATTTTMNITVADQITPTFTQIGPLCQNSTAPALPGTSTNGIAGTWSPAVISTADAGMVTYTFTPNAGQCATTTTMNITVADQITPTFTQIGPLCQNSTVPALPGTSSNGITGIWSPATINTSIVGTSTYTFTPAAGQCAVGATMDIVVTDEITPTFTPIGPLCQNSTAPALPGTSTNGITGTWSPATINATVAGTTTYTFTPNAGQCATSTTMNITVADQITPTFTQIGPLCQNSTAPALSGTSTNGITGTWSPVTINTSSTGTTIYIFTPAAGQCAVGATMDIVVTDEITPIFTQIGPLCQNTTAPALPGTSTNGITGTWSPATINTSTAGTSTYTFTPSAGQCATTTTINITVTAQIAPTFTQIGPLCQNTTAPVLPGTSNNGITGTWSPATINTSTAGTSTYTFTPAAGQCATSTTMNITVADQITPTFTQIGPLCQNTTPPALPGTSNNGITGTWSPATINTSTAGTSTYTFTPAAGQCATATTISITVADQITPTFTQVGPLCQNTSAPALPGTSNNGITGTWSPVTINTTVAGTTTYTFTPNAGQCATTTTMNITVAAEITPTFTQIGPLCQNSTTPALQGISTNGITGTWSPATINTSAAGTITYTFTPAAGQCATTTTMNITVVAQITPTFTQIGPLCQNSTAPVLPGTSNNGITGTWSPATINTASPGTTTYTFTLAAGQCATSTTMNITVTAQITPTFTQIGPLCQNSTAPALPGISTNGITGTWSPATINTASPGTTTYTFTPSAGQCATTTTMNITVAAQITPTFTQIGPVCQNTTAPALPGTSNNGITGTWSPAVISTFAAGTITYTFTPSAGQCATTTTMNITVAAQITPIFTQIGPLCQNEAAPALPGTSNNGITGTWNPLTISTTVAGTTTYTFTPAAGQCATATTMNVTITAQISPTFTQIGPLCQNSTAPSLPTTSIEGITGTWTPTAISTAVPGTVTYTFTTNNPSQCANAITMDITVSRSELTVTKTASQATYFAAGETITYTILVENTGNSILSNVTVTDPLTGLNANIPSMAPGAGNAVIYTQTYTVLQSDVNTGSITNTATAIGYCGDLLVTDTDDDLITAVQNPSLTLTKTSTTFPNTFDSAGDVLTYNILVTNDGNVILTNIIVSDPIATVTGSQIGTLAPGESVTVTASYTVTQDDLNEGLVYNTATARTTFGTDEVIATDDETVTANQTADWTLTKEAEETDFDEVGDVIHYNITIDNTGNVSISNIIVSDSGADAGSIRYISGDSNSNNRLDPSETWRYSATYTVTQADIDAGHYTNTATVNGNPPSGTIEPAEDTETVPPVQIPKLTVTKSTTVTSYIAAGEVIPYDITVTNTGNVTITGVVVSDPNADVTCAGAPYILAPGASITCYASHIVTIEDIFESSISNTATAAGRAPNGVMVTASSTVIIGLDNKPPEITCPQDIFASTSPATCDIEISAGLLADYSDPNDNVVALTWIMEMGGETIAESPVIDLNNISSHIFSMGVTTVTYTVTDALGESASCSFTVTVTDDTDPVAICRDISVDLDIETGTVSITAGDINNGSFDNCGIASMEIDVTDFDCTNLGPNAVTLTITDFSGNISTCTATVTVNYAVIPNPTAVPAADVICDGETISLVLTNNIPGTTWTWTVNSPTEITGASGDDSGELSVIEQTLNNSDKVVHNVIYTIIPQVYGLCNLMPFTAEVWVNPTPEIEVSTDKATVCDGESTIISISNPLGAIRGLWVYDLTVTPDEGIGGNTAGGTYTEMTDLTETLTNSSREIRKVEYIFTPRIIPDDGGADCDGIADTITLWVHPRITYTTEISDYNGFNISCYGMSDGYIRISPSPDLAPYTFVWSGPAGFTSPSRNINRLIAGEYTVIITDKNNCSVTETFMLIEPQRLGLTLIPSISNDGAYNINCDGGTTGSITVVPENNVGSVAYLWIDGMIGNPRENLSAGNYKVLIIDANNCQAEGSITLTDPEPMRLSFEVTNPYCDRLSDGEVRLTVTGGVPAGDYAYLWSDGTTQRNLANASTGDYTVMVTDGNGCTVEGTVRVGYVHDHCLIIPDAITPNTDGINDYWEIDNMDVYPDVIVNIYNRWGQRLWRSERGYPQPWDGTSNGKKLPIDAYHYTIELKNGYKLIIGTITIVDI